MSSSTQELSPPLKWYQIANINGFQKMSPDFKRIRVISFDWMKGLAILILSCIHLMSEWLSDQDKWLWQLCYLFVEYNGPVTFLFYAGINNTYAFRMKELKKVSFKAIYIETTRKMLGLLIVSTLTNVILSVFYHHSNMNEFSFYFIWDVLQTIGFSVILLIPLLRKSIFVRLIVSLIVYTMSFPIFLYLDNIQNQFLIAKILVQALFYPFLYTPLFPMMANAIVGSVVMDLLMPYVLNRNKELLRPLKYITFFSFLLMAMSIWLGSGPNTMPYFQDENDLVLSLLYINPILKNITYVPIFLLKMHPMSIFYRIALVTLLFCLAFYYFDVRNKPPNYQPSRFSYLLMIFGTYSLSYYVYIPLFVLIIPIDFGVYLVWPAMFVAMLLMTWIFQYILKKFYGAGLIEWLMMLFTIKWEKYIPMTDYKMYLEKGVILPPRKKSPSE